MRRFATSWYGRTDATDDPQQGDFFVKVPYVRTKKPLLRGDEIGKITLKYKEYSAIVLSQSCDLARPNKLETVVVAPVGTLKQFLKSNPHFKTEEKIESLRRNNVPRYHLLNKNPSKVFDMKGYLIVDFGAIFTISFNTLKALCEEQPDRLTLLSPYKEKLSQDFARYMMRVGLPDDIPEFNKTWLR